MLRKFVNAVCSIVFGLIGITCVIYYFGKFYVEKCLTFDENYLLGFSIVSAMIVISLIVGIVSYFKLESKTSKIIELTAENTKLIKLLSEQIENNHYSELSAIKSNMECILDLDSEVE